MREKRKKNLQKAKGSITVEATLVLPIFFFSVMAFVYFFQIMWIQERVNTGLWETAKEISQYSCVYEDFCGEQGSDGNRAVAERLIAGALTGERMKNYISAEFLENSCVVGGAYGIVYTTDTTGDDKEIVLVADYRVEIPMFQNIFSSIHMIQKVKTRAFVGTEQIGPETGVEEDTEVYITTTGSVYHTTVECTHLALSIQTKEYSQLDSARNQYGCRYAPCEQCVRNVQVREGSRVYITSSGNRYHIEGGCSGLTRNVRSIQLSEAGEYRPCSRCGN